MQSIVKTCGKCGETKPLERFTKTTGNKCGYRSPCKDCNNAYYAKRRIEKYEEVRTYERKFHKQRRLRYEYGITEDVYNHMKSLQNDQCAICKRETTLVIDHCHSTGAVRGLLCSKCNTGIGMFKENLVSLQTAIQYLQNQHDYRQSVE